MFSGREEHLTGPDYVFSKFSKWFSPTSKRYKRIYKCFLDVKST